MSSGSDTRLASIARLKAAALAVQAQTPYWRLSGTASSTDFEARSRAAVAVYIYTQRKATGGDFVHFVIL